MGCSPWGHRVRRGLATKQQLFLCTQSPCFLQSVLSTFTQHSSSRHLSFIQMENELGERPGGSPQENCGPGRETRPAWSQAAALCSGLLDRGHNTFRELVMDTEAWCAAVHVLQRCKTRLID